MFNSLNNNYFMSNHISENIKVSLAIKLARTTLGMNQQEFADKLGISKTTLARIELMEAQISLNFYVLVCRFFDESGITFEMEGDDINMKITPLAQQKAIDALSDGNRRADRKSSKTNLVLK